MSTAAASGSSAVVGSASPKKWEIWVGRGLSALPVLMMLMSAAMKFSQKPEVVAAFTGTFGYPEGSLIPLGVVELLCVVVYVIPQTAVLGAVLMTGYLGGATATHVRVAQPFVMPVVLGVVAWAGVYLRDPRLRALLPLRSKG